MNLTKKELSVLCSVLNGVNSTASTHTPLFNKKYGIEEHINEHLNHKEIDLLHEKLCKQLREVA